MKKRNDFKENNLMTKAISLISAILLWFFVMNVEDPVVTRTFRDINVTFQDVEDLRSRNLMILEPDEETITVELKGNRSYMDAVRPQNIQATVSLKGVGVGEHSLPVTVTNYNPNVKVVSQEPREILFTIDENVTVKEKIEVKTVGTLPDGYLLGDIKQNVEDVEISGPKTVMDKINSVIAYVDIKNRTETTVLSSPIKIFDDDMNELPLNTSPQNVDLELPIYKTKTVPVILDLQGTPPTGYTAADITVEPDTATISGNSAVVNKIKEVKTKPISWPELTGGQETIELVEPEGIKFVNPQQKYQLKYEKIVVGDKEVAIEKPMININNLSKGLTAEITDLPDSMTLTLEGNQEKLENIREENISLYIDGTGLEPGEHTVPVHVNTVDGISVKGLEPSRIKCTVSKIDG